MSRFIPWSQAVEEALYGPDGFYTRHSPHQHFATSAGSPLFAEAIARLVRGIDTRLESPAVFTLVDMGAGSAKLLNRVLELEDLDGRLHPVAVEVRAAPADLDQRIQWTSAVPQEITGLLLACEYLDNVPFDIAAVDDSGSVRYELVDPRSGETVLGDPVGEADARWLRQWWQLEQPGQRAEIGRLRDRRWRQLRANVSRGTALAIDYGHTRRHRPPLGTVTGYQQGRQVEPLCDGSRDVTAHVAMDSLGDTEPGTQRHALRELGISAGRPPLEMSRTDPLRYIAALSNTGEAATLTDPAGLGGHWWLRENV